ncbi:MAG: SOS response-associated peptidase [Natronomonas sp.]
MCGRTSLFVPRDELEKTFDATVVADGGYTPRYNIAPGDGLEVVTNEAPDKIDRFHWGLIPEWADDPGDGIINARSETASEKSTFAAAWESRPCLVLSSGFYEWQARNSGPKQPYRIYREEPAAFAMAGLWEHSEGTKRGDGESVHSVTILTTEPNHLVEPIHDRMPVVLPSDEESTWLEAGPDERAELCHPYPEDGLAAYEISTRVNDPTKDDPRVIEPLDHEQSGLDAFDTD